LFYIKSFIGEILYRAANLSSEQWNVVNKWSCKQTKLMHNKQKYKVAETITPDVS